jgi:glucose-1-phosphate cytidylyltransferase
VVEPFQRLIRDEQLAAYRYRGFWAAMDTVKDKLHFDEMSACDNTPWQVWKARAA